MINVAATSTALTSGKLANFDWSPGSSTTATGDLFTINIGSSGTTTGNLFNITDAGSSLFSVSEVLATTSVPASFTAPGDVSIAYDLNFTNPTASYIKSAAPLYIQAGEPFNSSDLTLKTYNAGAVVIDSQLDVLGYATVAASLAVGYTSAPAGPGNAIFSGKVGIGDSTPTYALDVAGDIKAGDGSLVILGSKVDPDPTGVNGGMYYNTTNSKFRCYEASTWKNCVGTQVASKTLVYSPEYEGAIPTASGSANITGNLTSDASPSANFRTYYEWSSTSSSLQDYTVMVRITLPSDFSTWATSNALQINFNTNLTTTDTNKLDVTIYNPGDHASNVVRQVTAQASGTAKTWTAVTIDDSELDDATSPDWDAAGETAVIYLKMYAKATGNYVQVGDIVLNYTAQ